MKTEKKYNWDRENFIENHWQKAVPVIIKGMLSQSYLEHFNFEALKECCVSPCFCWSYSFNGITEQPDRPIVRQIPEVEKSFEYFNYYKQKKESFTLFFDNLDLVSQDMKDLQNDLRIPFSYRQLDVCGSLSSINSGVGYHSDDKDVILFQMKGKRRWRVWDRETLSKEEYNDLISNKNLIQYPERTKAEPLIDEILEPGDALFLPFAFPHSGYTCSDNYEDSLSISCAWYGLSASSFIYGLNEIPNEIQSLLNKGERSLFEPLPDHDENDNPIGHYSTVLASLLSHLEVELSKENAAKIVEQTFDNIREKRRVH